MIRGVGIDLVEIARVERMLADPRAKAKIREFLFVWLKLDQSLELAKDVKRFPGFDANALENLNTSQDTHPLTGGRTDMPVSRKKLIEVALPLEAINIASARVFPNLIC